MSNTQLLATEWSDEHIIMYVGHWYILICWTLLDYRSIYTNYFYPDGEDYRADPRVLTFSPGVDRVCFDVSIIDDNRYELNEDFFVNLTTSDPQVDINPMTAVVTILDDESKYFYKLSVLWIYACELKVTMMLSVTT